MKLLMAFVFFIFTCNSYSLETKVEDGQCLKAGFEAVKDSLLNYENYHTFDDEIEKDVINVLGVKFPLHFIKMYRSKIIKSKFENGIQKTLLNIKLRPFSLGDKEQHPRLYLFCQGFEKAQAFTQKCQLLPSVQSASGEEIKLEHYAMKGFAINLSVYEDKINCPNSDFYVKYTITIDTNSKQVESIKSAVARDIPLLGTVIDSYFDERVFFANYFKKYYAQWAKSLNQ